MWCCVLGTRTVMICTPKTESHEHVMLQVADGSTQHTGASNFQVSVIGRLLHTLRFLDVARGKTLHKV